MDIRFHPAIAAVRDSDLARFTALLTADPSLATTRSSVSHPTLLQCLVLEAVGAPSAGAMARALIEHGADAHEPLIAAASIDNVEMVDFLLDAGASIEGDGRWSPLEEALYWGHSRSIALLVSHGAPVKNLRTVAGLGRVSAIANFFDADGSLRPQAGPVESPFPQLSAGPRAREPQAIINNAFVYACINDQIHAVTELLARGAAIDAIPPGFDFAGTGLHNAALRGHSTLVEFLLRAGADPTIEDTKVSSTPAGWAAHGGHVDLQALLQQEEARWLSGKR